MNTRKLITALWLLVTAAMMPAYGANRLTLSGLSGSPGQSVEVSVALESDVPAEGLQVSLTLPEGTAYEGGSVVSAGRAAKLSASGGVREGRLNLTLFSLNRYVMAAGSGEVMRFRITLGDTPLAAPVALSAVMAGVDGGRVETKCEGGTLSIHGAAVSLPKREYTLGRVALGEAQSLTVTVTNSGTETLELAGLNTSAAGWTLKAPVSIAPGATGNVNMGYMPSERGKTDGVIRFTGNMSGTVEPLIIHSEGFGRNEMTLTAAAVKGGEEATVSVRLKNYDAVCGFTLKVALPRGFRYVPSSFAVGGARGASHGVTSTVADLANGATQLTLTAYSLSNRPFAGNDGEVATFRVVAASRTGATLTVKEAILPAILDGKVSNVASAFDGTYLSVSSPTLSVTAKQNIGRTPVTQAEAGTVSLSNRGNEPLVISKVDFIEEGLEVTTPLPLTVNSWASGSLQIASTDGARGKLSHRAYLYCNDPETPVVALDLDLERYSPNELTLSAEEADMGDKIVIGVNLDNNDAVEGVQFDLSFDGQLSGTLTAVPTARAEGFNVSVSKTSEGRMRVLAYSLSGQIARGEGEILSLTLSPDKATEEGVYTLSATNIVLGDASMSNLHSAVVSPDTSVKVNFFLLGDLNGDRQVSVIDLNHCINHIVEPESSNIRIKAGDMNGDGEITMLDLNALIIHILN